MTLTCFSMATTGFTSRARSTTTTGMTTKMKIALPIHHSATVASLSHLGLASLRVSSTALRSEGLGLLRDGRQRTGDRLQLPVQDCGASADQGHVPLDRAHPPGHLPEGLGDRVQPPSDQDEVQRQYGHQGDDLDEGKDHQQFRAHRAPTPSSRAWRPASSATSSRLDATSRATLMFPVLPATPPA